MKAHKLHFPESLAKQETTDPSHVNISRHVPHTTTSCEKKCCDVAPCDTGLLHVLRYTTALVEFLNLIGRQVRIHFLQDDSMSGGKSGNGGKQP